MINQKVKKKSIQLVVVKYALLLIVLGFLILFLKRITTTSVSYVDIVRAKESIGESMQITTDSVYKARMIKEDYDQDNSIILWDNVDEILNTFAAYYIRKNAPLTSDCYTKEEPIKNEWLHTDEEGILFITLPYNRAECFGKILTPGDKLCISASYIETVENKDAIGYSTTKRVEHEEVLFDAVEIKDLLNSSGSSIYEYYKDLLSLSAAERQAMYTDDKFLNNITPVALIISVTQDEFSAFAKRASADQLHYTFGLHPRDKGQILTEKMMSISSEINRYIATKEEEKVNESSK